MQSGPKRLVDLALATYVILGYGAPIAVVAFCILSALVTGPIEGIHHGNDLRSYVFLGVGILVGVGWIVGTVGVFRVLRGTWRSLFRFAAEALALGFLFALAMLLNLGRSGECEVDACLLAGGPPQALADPEIFGVIALHGVTVLAYIISRRRPEALRPVTEAAVHGALLAGIALQTLLAVQYAPDYALGLKFFPLGQVVFAPIASVILYGSELGARLRRRSREGSRFVTVRATGSGALVVGAYSVLQGLWLHHTTGALQVFTRTCSHPMSTLPLHLTVGPPCHYLCTVAARGHAWLVRPERMGRRGGSPVVVNRQLAVANAFEDLLHTRWPRFGRLARRTYDLLGLPVSRWIRWTWLADLVYLAMKPLEWGFYVALLVLDTSPPEARIDRMYR